METQNVKATITQSKDGNLTLRVWLNDAQKELFCLQDGLTKSFSSVIIMNKSGDELTQTKRMEEIEFEIKKRIAEKQ